MDRLERLEKSKWAKNRKWFNVCSFAMVLHGCLTFGSVFMLYALFVPRYGFEPWEQVLWTVVAFLNLGLCKWGQWRHVTWEIYLDAHERRNGLNADYHEFVDDMKRLGKWPRSY
ncbi:hypothetical protein [Xanthomonas phage RTH11]|nr:hypothetical protein [Xanthomonas phage RTH11]